MNFGVQIPILEHELVDVPLVFQDQIVDTQFKLLLVLFSNQLLSLFVNHRDKQLIKLFSAQRTPNDFLLTLVAKEVLARCVDRLCKQLKADRTFVTLNHPLI